jgi:hypothetical protein
MCVQIILRGRQLLPRGGRGVQEAAAKDDEED